VARGRGMILRVPLARTRFGRDSPAVPPPKIVNVDPKCNYFFLQNMFLD
jgi:hypothetical protein